MAKIIGRIITEKHGFKNVMVRRPYGNEFIVEPEENDTADEILRAAEQAINRLAPYVRNCPIGSWTGRATTYLTVQPINGKKREEFTERAFKELKTSGLCLMREADFDGRVQLILYTPSPDDPIRPVENGFDTNHDSAFDRRYPWIKKYG